MKTAFLMCLVVACAASAQSEARESRIVQTAQGPVRGYKTEDDIFDFYGIPYATAPTGPNKFTAPLPGPVWMHTLEAVRNNVVCPQPSTPIPNIMTNISSFIVQEDCLVVNVHIPDTDETNLPVMVYVHGGAYQVGYGSVITTHSLVKSKKIVAVTFNYRVGIHGFLCLGTEGAPGNAGMKDQVALLRWVNKNIANFGGNPDDVTILGGSAGSSAVDLLMLSEATAGLYNKVIPESGANVGVWSIQYDPIEIAREFAKSKHFTQVDDIYALEEFYKTATYDILTTYDWFNRKDSIFVFAPCVERNIGKETFLEDTPVNILRQGKYRKVPVLNGFANMEGLTRISKFPEWKDAMNERFSDFLPADLTFRSDEERTEVAEKIKEFYFGDQPVGEDTILNYIDYFSDVMIAYPHLRSVEMQVAAGSESIYLYEYSFFSPNPQMDEMPEYMKNIKGANHCQQSFAVHGMPFGAPDNSEEYLKFQETLREIWLNFITTGKPVPEGSKLPAWPPVGPNRSPHMDLGEEIKLKGPLLEKRARFWDDIYERYYRMPVPPPKYSVRTEL